MPTICQTIFLPRSHWWCQKQFSVTTPGWIQRYHSLHVLQVPHFSTISLTGVGVNFHDQHSSTRYSSVEIQTLKTYDRQHWYEVLLKLGYGTTFAMVPRRYGFPLFGQGYHGASVKYPKSKEMVEFQSYTVHSPVETSFGIEERVSFRC